MVKRKSTKGHKQQSTKHTHKSKDRVTRIPLKPIVRWLFAMETNR
jgi:hypothetical protein